MNLKAAKAVKCQCISSSYDTLNDFSLPNNQSRCSLAKMKPVLFYKYSPSGSPSVFVFMTLSRADLKSAICTRILRSLRAMRPASEQIALISAPERSSFWLINSSRSTSSFRDIFEVCSVKILRFVFSLDILALSPSGI